MLYRIAWVMMWVTFRIFFRKVEVVGREKLLQHQPAILIANHPASFLDAMVLAVFLRRSIHFYVRGDIFSHPIAYRILTMLHMIPIYSREHGTNNLSRNNRTFERGRELLSKGKLLLIFPEGFSRLSKELVPLKKGAARVALQTAFEGGNAPELTIQSVAIDYSYHGMASNLFIRMGERMSIRSFENAYRDNVPACINQLTRAMQDLFVRNVLHIKQGDRTAAVERYMRMVRATEQPIGEQLYQRMQTICDFADRTGEEQWQQFIQSFTLYEQRLMQFHLSDEAVAQKGDSSPSQTLALLFLLFPAGIGAILWFIPEVLSKWIADKTVTRIDFYTSVHASVLGVLGLLWVTGITLVLYQFDWGWGALFGFVAPLFFYTYVQCKGLIHQRMAFRSMRKLKNTDRYQYDSLCLQQKELLELLSV
ncbi:MAG: hypothetical protein RIQ50_1015 [Bacteroidota bacterium]